MTMFSNQMAQKPTNISELKKEFGPPKNVNVVH